MMNEALNSLREQGRFWVRNAVAESTLQKIELLLSSDMGPGTRLNPKDEAFDSVAETARRIIGDCQPVRCVAFNKSTGNNWRVSWHQDKVIALAERRDCSGYKNWTRKAGIWHCEPPIAILEKTVFARIHLDESSKESGCLEIALGSHKFGDLSGNQIDQIVRGLNTEICAARRGDVMLAHSLILHRSLSSQSSAPRRAVRIDYSSALLDHPLNWAY